VKAVRRRAALALFAIAAGSYAIDRVTKVWAERTLPGDPIDLIPGVLTLRFTTNTGGAFSLFSNAPWFFVAVSVVISLLIVVTAFRHTDLMVAASLGLVLGGAVGNLTDRLVRGAGALGEVVDFIDLHVWPVFNLADSAIVVGAGSLAFASWRRDRAGRAAGAEGRDA
jgi:signal peptidase II